MRSGFSRLLLGGLPSLAILFITACGTTYEVTSIDNSHEAEAAQIFAEEQNLATRRSGARLDPNAAIRQWTMVADRLEPIAEQFCREHTSDRKNFSCDIKIKVDTKAPYRNAYQNYVDGVPQVVFTVPMIEDARNPDEIAFVMGHEVGHHLGEHLRKQ